MGYFLWRPYKGIRVEVRIDNPPLPRLACGETRPSGGPPHPSRGLLTPALSP